MAKNKKPDKGKGKKPDMFTPRHGPRWSTVAGTGVGGFMLGILAVLLGFVGAPAAGGQIPEPVAFVEPQVERLLDDRDFSVFPDEPVAATISAAPDAGTIPEGPQPVQFEQQADGTWKETGKTPNIDTTATTAPVQSRPAKQVVDGNATVDEIRADIAAEQTSSFPTAQDELRAKIANENGQ